MVGEHEKNFSPCHHDPDSRTFSKETFDQNNHQFIVGESFSYIIYALRFYGTFPCSIINKGRFYGKQSSFTLIWSAISIIFVLVNLAIYTLNRGFGIAWPVQIFSPLQTSILVISPDTESYSGPIIATSTSSRPPPFFLWVTMLLQVIIPFTSISSGLLGLIHLSSFKKFLNSWADFLKEMDRTFLSFYHVNFSDVRRYRNQYFCWILLPCLAFSIIFVPFLATAKILEPDQGSKFLNMAFSFAWFQGLLVIRMLCNVRDLMSFLVLNVAYRELRHAIQAQYECLQEKITHKHVHSWLQLVVTIREQKSLLEKHVGPQNLWLLVETFVLIVLVLTASFVAVLKEIREFYGMVGTFVGLSILAILLLYCKAQGAEAISEEEELLAESVVEMTASDDCETRLKVNS